MALEAGVGSTFLLSSPGAAHRAVHACFAPHPAAALQLAASPQPGLTLFSWYEPRIRQGLKRGCKAGCAALYYFFTYMQVRAVTPGRLPGLLLHLNARTSKSMLLA